MRTDLRIGIVDHIDHGKTTAMEMVTPERGIQMVNAPSPFDPEKMMITDMLQGFREDLFRIDKNFKKPKRNTNQTPPKKKRKRKH